MYELRDISRYGFLLPPEQVQPCSEEVIASYIDMGKELRKKISQVLYALKISYLAIKFYVWFRIELQQIFEDISTSRTNSKRTYRVDL